MLTVLAGLCSSAVYALSDMLAQGVTRRAGPLAVGLWVFATGTVVSLPAALLLDGPPSSAEQWRSAGLTALCGVLYVLGYGALLNGLRRGDLSLIAVLVALEGAYVAIFAVATGEPLSAPLGIALALAATGGVLAAFQGRAETAAGACWGLLSGLVFAAFFVLYDRADAIGWLSKVAFTRTTSLLVWAPIALLAGKASLQRELWPLAVGAGLMEMAGLALVAVAVSLGPLAVAGVSVSQVAMFAVLLGLVVLKERPRAHQLLGVVMALAGVTLLALY